MCKANRQDKRAGRPSISTALVMMMMAPLMIVITLLVQECDDSEAFEHGSTGLPHFDQSQAELRAVSETVEGIVRDSLSGATATGHARQHIAGALNESRNVSDSELLAFGVQLPSRYRTKFVRGLRRMLAGIDENNQRAFTDGWSLVQEWQAWYSDSCYVPPSNASVGSYVAQRLRDDRLHLLAVPDSERSENEIRRRILHGGKDVNTIVKQCLQQIEIGDAQKYGNMTVFPLFYAAASSIKMRTLDEALDNDILEVTEVDESGSVPMLKVVNKSDNLVLLLDGEELRGAKQNRVLNSTILLAGQTRIDIPVSCTEQGRWGYLSKLFSSSGHMMSRKLRTVKATSVAHSLSLLGKYQSDQSRVWASIDNQAAYAKVRSSTSAMSDVHDSLQGRLKPFQAACPYLPTQKGLLVAIDGQVVGFDLLTSDNAYKRYHSKVLRSYAIDALLSRVKAETIVPLEKAVAFIQQCSLCKEEEHASVGLGMDYRYTGPTLTGFALVHDDEVVHAAFLKLPTDSPRNEESPDREHVRPQDTDTEE